MKRFNNFKFSTSILVRNATRNNYTFHNKFQNHSQNKKINNQFLIITNHKTLDLIKDEIFKLNSKVLSRKEENDTLKEIIQENRNFDILIKNKSENNIVSLQLKTKLLKLLKLFNTTDNSIKDIFISKNLIGISSTLWKKTSEILNSNEFITDNNVNYYLLANKINNKLRDKALKQEYSCIKKKFKRRDNYKVTILSSSLLFLNFLNFYKSIKTSYFLTALKTNNTNANTDFYIYFSILKIISESFLIKNDSILISILSLYCQSLQIISELIYSDEIKLLKNLQLIDFILHQTINILNNNVYLKSNNYSFYNILKSQQTKTELSYMDNILSFFEDYVYLVLLRIPLLLKTNYSNKSFSIEDIRKIDSLSMNLNSNLVKIINILETYQVSLRIIDYINIYIIEAEKLNYEGTNKEEVQKILNQQITNILIRNYKIDFLFFTIYIEFLNASKISINKEVILIYFNQIRNQNSKGYFSKIPLKHQVSCFRFINENRNSIKLNLLSEKIYFQLYNKLLFDIKFSNNVDLSDKDFLNAIIYGLKQKEYEYNNIIQDFLPYLKKNIRVEYNNITILEKFAREIIAYKNSNYNKINKQDHRDIYLNNQDIVLINDYLEYLLFSIKNIIDDIVIFLNKNTKNYKDKILMELKNNVTEKLKKIQMNRLIANDAKLTNDIEYFNDKVIDLSNYHYENEYIGVNMSSLSNFNERECYVSQDFTNLKDFLAQKTNSYMDLKKIEEIGSETYKVFNENIKYLIKLYLILLPSVYPQLNLKFDFQKMVIELEINDKNEEI